MSNGNPVTYTVTGVTPDTHFSPTSTPIPGKQVAYSTSTGYEGSVFIPDTIFTDPAAVRLAVEGEVKAVAAVQGLAGTVGG